MAEAIRISADDKQRPEAELGEATARKQPKLDAELDFGRSRADIAADGSRAPLAQVRPSKNETVFSWRNEGTFCNLTLLAQ
jgi:hypothetical protein